jgi:hypothetical protein
LALNLLIIIDPSTATAEQKQERADADPDAKKKAHQVFNWLMRCLPAELKQRLIHVELGDAEALWTNLQGIFEEATPETRRVKKRRFLNLELLAFESFTLFVTAINLLASELNAIGVPIKDEDKLGVLLGGLTPEFNTKIDYLDTIHDLSFEKAVKELMTVDTRRERQQRAAEQANYTNTSGRGRGAGRFRVDNVEVAPRRRRRMHDGAHTVSIL